MSSNFDFLSKYWLDLAQIGRSAEMHVYSDTNICIYKLGQLSEIMVSKILNIEKMNTNSEVTHAERIKMLRKAGLVPQNVDDMLFAIRKARNKAVHEGLNSEKNAETLLKITYFLSVWFMTVYGDWDFEAKDYVIPENISKNLNYRELVDKQEAYIQELLDKFEEIETEGVAKSKEERTLMSEEISKKIEISDEEQNYLDDEQIRVDISVLPMVNFALQQNHVGVIQGLSVINNSKEPLSNVNVHIETQPSFSKSYNAYIDEVAGNTAIDVRDAQLVLDAEYLASLSERIVCNIDVVLTVDGVKYYEEIIQIDVLTYDEWHGINIYQEVLCSFITPNHPEVKKIIARAANYLQGWTGDPSLDGYQSEDINRVLGQAAAIYAAIYEENIVYANPPASFEAVGQRVRLCDAIMQEKMGTCLDLTLFYSACLEAIGLYPLLIIKSGHIFSGLWLEDKTFPDSVIEGDTSEITKRLADGVNEIAIVETTSLVAGKAVQFDQAMALARQSLIGTNSGICIIDVTRSRKCGVHPIPIRIATSAGWTIEREKVNDATSAPKYVSGAVTLEDTEEEKVSKRAQWERKLLDLGLRNTLINMRWSKNLVPIFVSSIDDLEDKFSDGSDFKILPQPEDMHIKKETICFENMHELGNVGDLIYSEFENKRLRAAMTDGELNQAVKSLYRSAKTTLEETGVNTLYIALGIIKWFEKTKSSTPRFAPIVLLPIELIRKSATQGYTIRMRDEDPQMNITILEKLKQDNGIDIKGLDPLPSDGHGVDMRRVFSIIRQAIMGQSRWDVLESAYIGPFSFSQFVMWNDIRNRTENLEKNKIVKSLIEGRLVWDAHDMEIGERVSEDDMLLPISADSSQLFAIKEACKNKSFVLHGPPGTGKSQTITALMANAMVQGKTVLFVAEKMAALSVVQKRLDKIGLAPFCLELHSNKSKKKEVLEQLRIATEVTKTISSAEYLNRAEKIKGLRDELNTYANQLHCKQPCGISAFTLINKYEKYRDAPELDDFDHEDIISITSQKLDDQQLLVEQLIAAAKAVGHPHNSALEFVECTQYSQQMKTQLQLSVKGYKEGLQKILPQCEKICNVINITMPQSINELARVVTIRYTLEKWNQYPKAWTRQTRIKRYLVDVKDMAQHFINKAKIERELLSIFNQSFFHESGEELLTELKEINEDLIGFTQINYNKLKKRIAVHLRERKTSITKEFIVFHATQLINYNEESSYASEMFKVYGDELEDLYNGICTEWIEIVKAVDGALLVEQQLEELFGGRELGTRIFSITDLLGESSDFFLTWKWILQSREEVFRILGATDNTDVDSKWFEHQIALCDGVMNHSDDLKEWIMWKAISRKANEYGLKVVVNAYQAGLEHERVMSAYKKAIYRALVLYAIDTNPALNTFSGKLFDEKIKQLKRIDNELMKLTEKEIFCRLAANVPNLTSEATKNSELAILSRAIKSGGRGVSIRILFDQISTVLRRLCPCMLMSPLSVAQYLDPNGKPFDIVIFDEASQLPTSKAIGALARANNAIIVGDPKQMPPTSFFMTNSVDEENYDVEDLESILDDCLALNMPQTHLLWHYRSKHESLIAFSNAEFYENKLYTFPSVNDRESRVSFVQVDGYFDRGKTRQNRAEAEKIIDEVVKRYNAKELKNQSIGIVTFNSSQQNLIDDLFQEKCKKNTLLEEWANSGDEPLFIKNLENVQGDERDVIFFSVGYGPDQDGKVYMNFGPLNREGGWRRLNVAVSRARMEMIVFSSLTPDQINLNKTSSRGVKALKGFLEFADGRSLLSHIVSSNEKKVEVAGIAASISEYLKEQGYNTDRNIGHSEYRIDVGIIDPIHNERYLLGILLDGNNYKQAKTTRDREVSQVSVLASLGWNTIRIWSMDWWDSRDKELNRILEALRAMEIKPAECICEEGGKTDIYIKTIEDKSEMGRTMERLNTPHIEADIKSENGSNSNEKCDSVLIVESSLKIASRPQLQERTENETENEAKIAQFVSEGKMESYIYQIAQLKQETVSISDFLTPKYNLSINGKLMEVLNIEAPISEELLVRRVAQSYGIGKAGSRIKESILKQCGQLKTRTTIQNGSKFYWKNSQDPSLYNIFRISGNDEENRLICDVPVHEISNAICATLGEYGSMPLEDVLKMGSRMLGYTRMGSNVITCMKDGYKWAVRTGKVEEDKETLTIVLKYNLK